MGLQMGSHSYDQSQLKTYKAAILFQNGKQTHKVNTTHILTLCNGMPGLMIGEWKNQHHWLSPDNKWKSISRHAKREVSARLAPVKATAIPK